MNSEQLIEMNDREYRHGLVSTQIEVDLPLQIRALRKQRNWTQPELAQAASMRQPRISAMEKLGGGSFTLETLRRLAQAFDVALIVRFAPFSELLRWNDQFDPENFQVADFNEELSARMFTMESNTAELTLEQPKRIPCSAAQARMPATFEPGFMSLRGASHGALSQRSR